MSLPDDFTEPLHDIPHLKETFRMAKQHLDSLQLEERTKLGLLLWESLWLGHRVAMKRAILVSEGCSATPEGVEYSEELTTIIEGFRELCGITLVKNPA